MNQPNLLLIIPNLGSGGAQRVFRDQLKFYQKHANVLGCVFNWDGAFADDHIPGIVSLDVPGGTNIFQKGISFLRRVRKLRQLKKSNNIQISVSHLEGADYVNILSSEKDRTILWVHGTKKSDKEIRGFIGWIRRRVLIPLLYSRSCGIITVSNGIRQELIEEYTFPADMVTTIYNGIQVDEIGREGQTDNHLTHVLGGSNVLITHCRLARQKNLEALIEIFSEVRKKKPLKLVIVGDGEQRKALLQLSRELQLTIFSAWDSSPATEQADIYFVGYQSNPYSFISRGTLFVMTSDWEGFPLALCEAMACGVPVMATDCYTGPREILAPQIKIEQPVESPLITPYGWLMPLAHRGHYALWAETIQKCLEDGSARGVAIQGGLRRVSDFERNKAEQMWLSLIQDE